MTCLRSPDTLSVYSETTHPPSATALRRSTPSARVDERFFNVRTDAGPALNLWLHPSSVLVTEPISLREGGGGQLLGGDKTASGKTEHQTRSSWSTADEYLDGFSCVIYWNGESQHEDRAYKWQKKRNIPARNNIHSAWCRCGKAVSTRRNWHARCQTPCHAVPSMVCLWLPQWQKKTSNQLRD